MVRIKLAIVFCLCMGASAAAQRPNRPSAKSNGPAVSIQLPTFHWFESSTSVLVPDRGRMGLGGIGRYSGSQNTFRAPLLPWASRATASRASAAETSVSAWIHDFDAMDQQLLQAAAAMRCAEAANGDRGGNRRAGNSRVLQSVTEIRRQQAAQDEQIQLEARQQFARGQAAEAAGKLGAAKIFYQMASRTAVGELKTEIQARLRQLNAQRSK